MLVLVTIFLTSILVAALAVWLYRLLFSWKGEKRTTDGRLRSSASMEFNSQHGYIALAPRPKKRAQGYASLTQPYAARKSLKAPWGW